MPKTKASFRRLNHVLPWHPLNGPHTGARGSHKKGSAAWHLPSSPREIEEEAFCFFNKETRALTWIDTSWHGTPGQVLGPKHFYEF